LQFLPEKNAFLFSCGKNSARSRRVARGVRARRRAAAAAAGAKIFLQNG
jgi:hypothetical protein